MPISGSPSLFIPHEPCEQSDQGDNPAKRASSYSLYIPPESGSSSRDEVSPENESQSPFSPVVNFSQNPITGKFCLMNRKEISILWLDDTKSNQIMYGNRVKNLGISNVEFVANSEEFNNKITLTQDYHIIVFDEELGSDPIPGSELASYIKKTAPQIKRISCSTLNLNSNPDFDHSIFDAYLPKIWTHKDLVTILENFVSFTEDQLFQEFAPHPAPPLSPSFFSPVPEEQHPIKPQDEPTPAATTPAFHKSQVFLEEKKESENSKRCLDCCLVM